MTIDAQALAMVKALSAVCFRSVWNEVRAQARINLKLTALRAAYHSGNAVVGARLVPLPQPGSFIVYKAALSLFFGSLSLPGDVWVRGDEITARCRTLLSLYSHRGLLAPRGQFWVRRVTSRQEVLVALAAPAAETLYGLGGAQELYLTSYHDSDIAGRVTTASYRLDGGAAQLSAIQAEIATYRVRNPAALTMLLNGVEIDPARPYTTKAGDYLDLVFDEDVLAAFDVDVSIQTTGYYSESDQRYKELIHIPKALNPDNAVITHNTCDLWVRDKLRNQGRYFHRCDADAVTQVTHNDLAAATTVIDALRDELGSQDVVLRVQLRRHQNDNHLIDEVNYLRLLYSLDDVTIVKHLRGEITGDLAFWKASHLEQSAYVKLMFDIPDYERADQLSSYVAGLGYYTVARMLAANLGRQTVQAVDQRSYDFAKPFALQGREVMPLVYLAGRKLRTMQQVVHSSPSPTRLRLTLADQTVRQVGQSLQVAMLEGSWLQPEPFTPSLDTPKLVVEWSEVMVYRKVALATPLQGLRQRAEVGWQLLPARPGTLMFYPTASGGLEVVCGPSLYGSELLIQPKRFAHPIQVNLDDQVGGSRAVSVALEVLLLNGDSVPLLGYAGLEVYANGRLLVPDLDYTAKPLRDPDGAVGLVEVILSAREPFVNQPGNWLEVIAHTDQQLAQEGGFVIDNRLSNDNAVVQWQPGLSRASGNNLLLDAPAVAGTYLEPGTSIANGRPYQLLTVLPQGVAEALDDYDAIIDGDRLAALNRYFHRTTPATSNPIIIPADPGQYELYSPYLAEIISDLIAGRFQLANEPNDKRFLAQLAPYAYLKERDPTVTRGSLVDPRFCDVLPLFNELSVSEITTYQLMERLIKLVLPNDPVTLGANHD